MSLWHPEKTIDYKQIADVLIFGKTPTSSGMFLNILLPLQSLPGTTRSYGSMVLWRNRFLFILRGHNSTELWCYDIEKNVFRTLALAPTAIYYGSLVGVHADRYLYTCRGYDGAAVAATTTFYRYDIWTNTWATVAAIPDAVDYTGGAAVYDGSRYIYLLRGGGTSDFYRYDCTTNTWATMASLPVTVSYPSNLVKAGNYLYVLVGNATAYFYRYDIANNTWTAMADAPSATRAGALAWDGGDYIYALRGYALKDFFRYRISTNTWETLLPAPAATEWGGLCYYNSPALGDIIFVKRGNVTVDWWIYKV